MGERTKPKPTAVQLRGPLQGHQVLVLGGPHLMSARVRDHVAAAGERVAVNLTPTVSDVIALAAADSDPRWLLARVLPKLDPLTLTPVAAQVDEAELAVDAIDVARMRDSVSMSIETGIPEAEE